MTRLFDESMHSKQTTILAF